MPVAHRGLHGNARPENSRAAFAAAADAGFSIELDVRQSRDGEVVVYHDADLERLTGSSGLVGETDAATLRELSLCGTTETIPLLEDVLALIDDRAPLWIEIKHEGDGSLIGSRVCGALSGYAGRVALMSFHAPAIEDARCCAPTIPRGLLFSPPGSSPGGGHSGERVHNERDWVTSVIVDVQRLGAVFVGCDVRGLPYEPVRHLRGKVSILGWTVTSAASEEKARTWCDNVIFEGYTPEV
jgi:glycerophosphoryl diester phosphodiesterase